MRVWVGLKVEDFRFRYNSMSLLCCFAGFRIKVQFQGLEPMEFQDQNLENNTHFPSCGIGKLAHNKASHKVLQMRHDKRRVNLCGSIHDDCFSALLTDCHLPAALT